MSSVKSLTHVHSISVWDLCFQLFGNYTYISYLLYSLSIETELLTCWVLSRGSINVCWINKKHLHRIGTLRLNCQLHFAVGSSSATCQEVGDVGKMRSFQDLELFRWSPRRFSILGACDPKGMLAKASSFNQLKGRSSQPHPPRVLQEAGHPGRFPFPCCPMAWAPARLSTVKIPPYNCDYSLGSGHRGLLPQKPGLQGALVKSLGPESR